MKAWTTLAVVAVVALAAGCRTVPTVKSEDTPFGKLQEQAAEMLENGGLATVGMGESSSASLALDKAKTRARSEMAMVLESKLEAMRKDFTEEIGESKIEEVNAMFTSASKVIASQVLRGTVPVEQEFVTRGGHSYAYVLMVQSPKVIADYFAQQVTSEKALYTRFRASQAFKELGDSVKEFEAFKREQAMPVELMAPKPAE